MIPRMDKFYFDSARSKKNIQSVKKLFTGEDYAKISAINIGELRVFFFSEAAIGNILPSYSSIS